MRRPASSDRACDVQGFLAGVLRPWRCPRRLALRPRRLVSTLGLISLHDPPARPEKICGKRLGCSEVPLAGLPLHHSLVCEPRRRRSGRPSQAPDWMRHRTRAEPYDR